MSKWVQPELVETGPVFSYALAVFTRDNNETFGVLSSGFHWWWAVRRSSTLEDRVRYALTDAFGTFPVPMGATRIDSLGAELAQHRAAMRVERQESLTATYNRYHDPGDHAEDIDGLRQIHVQLDHEVRDAYGWSDLELGHDFHETRLGVRFTFEPIVRQEILDRLLELNHARYADEVRRGRHGAATLRSSRRSTPTDVMNLEL